MPDASTLPEGRTLTRLDVAIVGGGLAGLYAIHRLRGMIGHRRQRENQILKLLGEGIGEITAMVPQMYKGVDEQLWPAAGRSVMAHLIDLERRGMVTRAEAQWRRGG